jgi:hypothetical protein
MRVPSMPPSEALRSSLGTVGVVSVVLPPQGGVSGPIGVGRQAAMGFGRQAAAGASGFAAAAAAGGAGVAAIVVLPVVAAAALIDAAGEAIAAIPESTAEDIESTLRETVALHDPQPRLRSGLVAWAGQARREPPIDLGVGEAANPAFAPDYARLAERGVQTVLEVGVLTATFSGEGGRNPDLSFSMRARARLIRISDKQVLWSDERLAFSTTSHRFSEWKANDAALLKSVIDSGVESFARRISDRTFLEVWTPNVNANRADQ